MSWLVVYTTSRGEYLAWSQIIAAGFESYYPVGRKITHKKGKFKWAPVFPRYIFLKHNPMWSLARWRRGVQDILRDENGTLFKINDYVIEEIKKRQLAGEFDDKEPPKKRKRRAKGFQDLKAMIAEIDMLRAA